MATKAQQFRREQQRTGHRRRAHTTSAAPHRRDTDDSGARNRSLRAGKKAQVATEESRSGRPSRKSSRRGVHRGKNSTVLEYAERMKSNTPQAQHSRLARGTRGAP